MKPVIRIMRPDDEVWLRPIAEKYDAGWDLTWLVNDPDDMGVIIAVVIAPYCLGTIYVDEHGLVLEGLTDTYNFKNIVHIGRWLVDLADRSGFESLHCHADNKHWHQPYLRKLGFRHDEKLGMVRHNPLMVKKEVA